MISSPLLCIPFLLPIYLWFICRSIVLSPQLLLPGFCLLFVSHQSIHWFWDYFRASLFHQFLFDTIKSNCSFSPSLSLPVCWAVQCMQYCQSLTFQLLTYPLFFDQRSVAPRHFLSVSFHCTSIVWSLPCLCLISLVELHFFGALISAQKPSSSFTTLLFSLAFFPCFSNSLDSYCSLLPIREDIIWTCRWSWVPFCT